MNLRGALLEYCYNAAYIRYVKTVFFLSVCDTPEVSCTGGTEHRTFLFLVERLYILLILLAENLQFGGFFMQQVGPCNSFGCHCFDFLLKISIKKTVLLQQRLIKISIS